MWGGVLTGSCCSKSNILWYIVEKPLYEFGIIYWRPKTEGGWKIAYAIEPVRIKRIRCFSVVPSKGGTMENCLPRKPKFPRQVVFRI